MDFDKIKQSPIPEPPVPDKTREDVDFLRSLIKRFPDENTQIEDAIKKLQPDYTHKLEGSPDYHILLNFVENKIFEPHWDDVYFQTKDYWYVLDKNQTTLQQICYGKQIYLSDNTHYPPKVLSNTVDIPVHSIELTPAEVDKLKKCNPEAKRKLPKLFDTKNIMAVCDLYEMGIMNPYIKGQNIIAHTIHGSLPQNKYNRNWMQVDISMYAEGSVEGERRVSAQEVKAKIDRTVLETKLGDSVIDAIEASDFNKDLEEYLCQFFKENPDMADEPMLDLTFGVWHDIYGNCDITFEKPDCIIAHRPVIVCISQPDCDTDTHSLVTVYPKPCYSIQQLSEMFWRCEDKQKIVKDSLYGICDSDIYAYRDDDFADRVEQVYVDRVKDTGLKIVGTKCTYDDLEGTFEVSITVKNPAYPPQD